MTEAEAITIVAEYALNAGVYEGVRTATADLGYAHWAKVAERARELAPLPARLDEALTLLCGLAQERIAEVGHS